jgi:hypothetical protein
MSFYEASVPNYLQILRGLDSVMAKGKDHFAESGTNLADVVEMRLTDDMLPFRFQVVSATHHSLGAMQGIAQGAFQPPPKSDQDYEGLQTLVKETIASLDDLGKEAVDFLTGKDMEFRMGSNAIPFTSDDFLLSFSMPNFYFHVTTAYDILRREGVPIGKMDFLGKMRIKR